MGRRYTVTFSGTAVTAAQDLFFLNSTGSQSIALRTLAIGCVNSGQSAVELLPILVNRFVGGVTAGTGGTAPTPQPLDQGDKAATFTARVNDTTRATATSGTNALISDALNIVNGYFNQFEPQSVPRAWIGGALVVRLELAPVASRTLAGYVVVEEMS